MNRNKQILESVSRLTVSGVCQSDIAKMMGVSRQRVGQLVDKAEKAGLPVVRRRLKHKICVACGSLYRGVKKYCSKECRISASPPKFGGPSSQIEMDILVCDGCGAKFSRTKRQTYIGEKLAQYRGKAPPKRKFCTKDCYDKNRKESS